MRVLGMSHKNQGTIVHCARDYVNNELTIYNVRPVGDIQILALAIKL